MTGLLDGKVIVAGGGRGGRGSVAAEGTAIGADVTRLRRVAILLLGRS